jgi:GH24 family phage-related lysozyme (muramidase)
MRQVVRGIFPSWSARFEGSTRYFYCDIKGLVTIGVGLLAEPLALVNGLAFRRSDNTPATAQEVGAAWLVVKSRQDLRTHGGGAYAGLTTLRATQESLDWLLVRKLDQMEARVRATFPEWDTFPAAAQLAMASMMWAAGPVVFAGFPRFSEAVRVQDWTTCAQTCHLDDSHNPGLRPRNSENAALFLKAAAGGCPDTL